MFHTHADLSVLIFKKQPKIHFYTTIADTSASRNWNSFLYYPNNSETRIVSRYS